MRTYLGYNTLSLSPYTLAGHQFMGAGVVLNPPGTPLSVSLVYGRLLKAAEFDSRSGFAAYRRMGTAMKAEANFSKAQVGISCFYSWDDAGSILPPPDSLHITPMENLAVSLHGSIQPFSGLSLELDVGNSVLTDDAFSAISDERKFWGGIIPSRSSTSSYWAYRTGINYGLSFGSLGVGFEWIEPNYQTLGAYYFTNDLENITVNAATRLWEGKVNLSGNIGIQRDNLDNQKMFASQRVVGSANISANPAPNISINTAYSSFNSYTYLRSVFDNINATSPYQNLDTLNFTQVNRSGNININVGFGEDPVQQAISLSLSGNRSDNKESGANNQSNLFLNSGLTHSLNLTQTGWSLASSGFYSINQNPFGTQHTLGPFINLSRNMKEINLRAGISGAYNQTWMKDAAQGKNYNFRLHGSWEFKNGHSLNGSGGFFRLLPVGGIGEGRADLVFNLRYLYNFSHQIALKKQDGNPMVP